MSTKLKWKVTDELDVQSFYCFFSLLRGRELEEEVYDQVTANEDAKIYDHIVTKGTLQQQQQVRKFFFLILLQL